MSAAPHTPARTSAAWTMPLSKIDVSKGDLFEHQEHWDYFARLRRDDPVHHCAESDFGPYWSITKFNDIVQVETSHAAFSSDRDIVIGDAPGEFSPPMFIAMDPPIHDEHRKTVTPAVSPARLAELEPLIRERAGKILDGLPRNETFNWVDRVSIELTTQMLATLFDFPFEDRHLLPYWSDVTTSSETVGNDAMPMARRQEILMECLAYFTRLWNERVNTDKPGFDFISLLARGPSTKDMYKDPLLYLGTLMLLIVGGNDTTRNSLSGGVVALNKFPREYDKLRANPALIPSMVSEIIRFQTPLAHMRRTAIADKEIGGKMIKKGDKVVMWYISGNRDETAIDNPDQFIIDRANPRHHLSFGFGIHRCMGNRVAEMQLKIVWEEILKRFPRIELVGEPVRVKSNFVHGFTEVMVRIPT
ncbi:MAG: cytochrome P450 [Alphaproteobacteria bacterium]|nr:cytochrome P450 [Alphaproteobacteria bacterium]